MISFLANLTLVKIFIITLEGTTIVVVVAALVVVVAALVVVATATTAAVLEVATTTATSMRIGSTATAATVLEVGAAAAAWTATIAPTTTTLGRVLRGFGRPATAIGGISRGLEGAGTSSLEQLDALIEVGDHAKELIGGDMISSHIQSRDDGLVFHVETGDDERDEFIFADWFSCSREFVRQRPHLPKVGGGTEGTLLGIGESNTAVVDARHGFG